MDELRLIREAAKGNMGSFAQLVQAHREQVLRAAYGIVGSIEDAEDVAQEVFVKVWNSLGDFRPGYTFKSWLYRITVNTAIDALRSRRASSSLPVWQADPADPPEQRALQDDERDRVRCAIAQLPPGARAALVLREYEQLSYQEIAQVLSIPIGTVMSRLNYARQLLRQYLAEEEWRSDECHEKPAGATTSL